MAARGWTMIVANIETVALRIPFKAGSTSDASAWGDRNLPAADSLLVKVTTDTGLQGWGEAFGFRAVASAKLAVDELIAPLCIGQDATRVGPLMLEVQKKLHVFGRGGALAYGMSAVDIALWDIAGKAANASVCQLLGGGVTDMPCYASLIRYSEPSLVRAAVRLAIEAGFRTLKLHEIEVSAIRAAREEAGPDIALTVDVNCPWTLTEARAHTEQLKAVSLKWLGGAAVAAGEFRWSCRTEEDERHPDCGRGERFHTDGIRALARRQRGQLSSFPSRRYITSR